MSCRPTEFEEPTPNSTNDSEKTIARARKTHLPPPFRRSVKSRFSCGAAALRWRVERLTFFFGPTEYPWVPLVFFCSVMASRPLSLRGPGRATLSG